MQTPLNTFNPDFLFFDNPSDPTFFNVPSKLDFIQNNNSSTFIKPPIPIPLSSTFNPPLINRHVLDQSSQPTQAQGFVGQFGSVNPIDGSVLSQQPLSGLDCSGWFTPSLSTEASSASASALTHAPASASATMTKGDASGFDHLSPFDEVCASALNTPYAPYLDTPDQTPTQTPLFDSVASEDLCLLQLDDLWTPSAVANDTGFAQTSSTLDFDLSFISSSASAPLSSTTQSGQAAQDDVQVNARLQAENALLDFVLFDDIAFPSPISTFSTPMTTTLTSPSSANSKDFETNELAMQLVAAAAASMSSQSTLTSTPTSPLTIDTSDVLGSLFSDVDLSPIMETTTTSPTATATATTAAPLFSSDFVLDCAANAVNSFSFDSGNDGFEIQPSPMISLGTTSPPMDMNIFFSLCSQQQQQQQQQQLASLFPSPLLSAAAAASALSQTATSAENPLKRKADEVQQAGEESPRQFVCAVCGRAFSRLFNLNTHERTHDRSKARLFACPEQGCTKTFTRRNDCQRHQISIHKVTDIYSCNKCSKRFSSREELRSHTDRNCQEDH
ncbi:hypothetical protein KI688_010905 [Linnemannia hyalina]|uniref:C2H2-type domain-containing protein n=1 Tax=Linnemannia hyalina TaxID=64524 RepID=A0A9P7XWA0_9FUNG|nr:hypothetical protein KI688_010905 [Linnemannia hyalina]